MTTPEHDDRDMSTAVRSWLREDDGPEPGRQRHIGRIMGRVDETKQRRRLWPMNPFGRRAVHSATGTEEAVEAANRRTIALAPVRVMSAVALAVVLATAMIWVAARPQAAPMLSGSWEYDPADEVLLERLVTLWSGEETDLATTLDVYAEDAVHDVLWLDEVESFTGNDEIWSRMSQTASVDRTDQQLVRLDDHPGGAHRYLLLSTSVDGAACVIWIKEEQITRHDCIHAASIEDDVLPVFPAISPPAVTASQELSGRYKAALGARDRGRLEQVASPQIVHHVLSENQVYRLEGVDEYWDVMGYGGPTDSTHVGLPAPEGELRWADFSAIGGGTLCSFWARDDLVVRHDCIVSGTTTVAPSMAEPR